MNEEQLKRLRVQKLLEMAEHFAQSEELRATIKEIHEQAPYLDPSNLYSYAASRVFFHVDHEASCILWAGVMVAVW